MALFSSLFFIIMEVNNERSKIQNNEAPIIDKCQRYFQNLHYTILTKKKQIS